ncbi:MAG: hypothetical protein AAFZ80_08010 [Cyanobacteria bacterium P01_A01_bin.105]
MIFGGMHDAALTAAFLAQATAKIPVLEDVHQQQLKPLDLIHTISPLQSTNLAVGLAPTMPVGVIAFSAGVVAAVGWLQRWQQLGGQVAGLIAVDGWGVPLTARYPTFRLSHDQFTHRSSMLLGGGPVNFYADPAVPHLTLWRTPQTIPGWQVDTQTGYTVQATTALAFIAHAVNKISAPF